MSDAAPGALQAAAQSPPREQVANARNNPPPVGEPPVPLERALEDRLLFSRAEGLLAGLMGCTPSTAGRALLAAGEHLGLSPRGAAESLLELMATAEGQREPLLLLLAAATAQPRDRKLAIETLWEEHGAACYALAVAILSEEQLAGAVIRSVFLTVSRNEMLFGNVAAQRASLLRATRREAIVTIRDERAAAGGVKVGVGPAESHGATRVDVPPVHLDAATIGSLSGDQDQIVRLAYFGGYTQRQIAQITGSSLKEVKAGMLAALRNLAEERRRRTAAGGTGSGKPAGPEDIAGLGLLL
jgi:DNA-directed RNA polymerase specialized sigma24 family protein